MFGDVILIVCAMKVKESVNISPPRSNLHLKFWVVRHPHWWLYKIIDWDFWRLSTACLFIKMSEIAKCIWKISGWIKNCQILIHITHICFTNSPKLKLSPSKSFCFESCLVLRIRLTILSRSSSSFKPFLCSKIIDSDIPPPILFL